MKPKNEFKDITKEYLQNHLNKIIAGKKDYKQNKPLPGLLQNK